LKNGKFLILRLAKEKNRRDELNFKIALDLKKKLKKKT
jgi:hypothetical protein